MKQPFLCRLEDKKTEKPSGLFNSTPLLFIILLLAATIHFYLINH